MKRALTSHRPAASSDKATPRSKHKLSLATRTEIVEGYTNGTAVLDLTQRYSVSKTTVIGVLNKAQVTRRPRTMSIEQIDEASLLYESGLSLARIGDRLGFTARTVHLRLLERGVTMRDTHGRPR